MSEGYIKISDLLDFCDNQKDHSITPNDIIRMNHSYFAENYPCWISVKDRLPDAQKDYLVFRRLPTRAVTIAWYAGENGWLALDGGFYTDGVVTHFMPLPEPPEEDIEE